MRIAILIPGFPQDENDSSCLPAFQQFALSLKKCYPQNEFIFVAFQYPYFRRAYFWNGIRIIALGGKNRPGVLKRFTWYRAYEELRKLHREKELHGIFSIWLSECALVGDFFCRRNRLKHYMWLIGQDARRDNQYIRRIKPGAENTIAMSDFLKEEFYRNHGVKPFMVVQNGINETAFPKFNSGNRHIDVLGVGSLTALKNYNLFLEIIYELAKKRPGIKSLIAGTGDEEEALKEKVKALGLSDNVAFAGLVPHSEVLELMSASKVFLHTSHYEGNSTVLMEALYSGCYTVSTQSLSNSNIKNLEIGDNKDTLLQLVLNLMGDSKAKAERVVFNTMDNSAKKIMDLYL